MPVDPERLRALADAYTAPMTSIRGRRVHRLILRELAAYDTVETTAEGGLRALSTDGSQAMLHTDGRGAAYEIVRIDRNGGRTVTAYDALKDSLPVLDT